MWFRHGEVSSGTLPTGPVVLKYSLRFNFATSFYIQKKTEVRMYTEQEIKILGKCYRYDLIEGYSVLRVHAVVCPTTYVI